MAITDNKKKEATLDNCDREIVEIQTKYREIKEQNKDLLEKLAFVKHEKEDIKHLSDKLLEEIFLVKKLNEEKEDTIVDIMKEKKTLQENVDHLQKNRRN